MRRTLFTLAAFGLAGPATAQQPTPYETFQLVATNVASGPVIVYGGTYILSQACAGYGTLTVSVLDAHRATYVVAVTKTASDGAAGTVIQLGSFARVQPAVSGTTGCDAILARVPA